jgi:hypothetical protein
MWCALLSSSSQDNCCFWNRFTAIVWDLQSFRISSFHFRFLKSTLGSRVANTRPWCNIRAALHLEAGPIRCVRGLKSSLVIGQKAQISPNPFTPRGQANLVVWFFLLKKCMLWHSPSSLNWVHPKWRANSWSRGHCHISLKKPFFNKVWFVFSKLDPLDYVKI